MKRTVCTGFIAVFLAASVCFAADTTTIEAELDKSSVKEGETVTYKLTIVSSEQRIPAPVLPDFRGLAVLSSSQSSSLSFQGGRSRTMMVFVFVLLPQEPGEVKIGPASLTVSGRTINTKDFVLKVVPGLQGQEPREKQLPRRQPERRLPSDLGGQPRYEI